MAHARIDPDGIIRIADEHGVFAAPKAEEIFSKVFTKPDPEFLVDLQTAKPGISFSRLAVTPILRIDYESGSIQLSVFFEKRGEKHNLHLSFDGGTDHLVVGTRWFYCSAEYQNMEDLLSECGIASTVISFAQYIHLLDARRKYPSLILEDYAHDLFQARQTETAEKTPSGLQATLYPYQETGLGWLKWITDESCGCILGDEMGLGKTIQIIALLLDQKHKQLGTSLIVAPVSLLENWRRELKRFAPELNVLIHHGNKRTGFYKNLLQYDVVVTAYSTVSNDLSMMYMPKWNLLILDEAQNIKNPDAGRTRSIKTLKRRAGIAVTGTPFENHITDLWSLLDFVMPGYAGTRAAFENSYSDDIRGAEMVEPVLSLLMIRRRVADVAKELPEKIEIPVPLKMSETEAFEYEKERKQIRENAGGAASLAMFTRLRMFCTHPFLNSEGPTVSDPAKASIKYTRLCELLDEIIGSEEKTILFTSYTGMADILRNDIPARFNIPVMIINGETPVPQRQNIIDGFSNIKGAALLVLNPKAAGVGLNITAANHVIHYNLEWNPALEDQATARAFRRGQEKTVFVYRLYYADTVEELVNKRIQKKRSMFGAAVTGSDGTDTDLELLQRALTISPLAGGDY